MLSSGDEIGQLNDYGYKNNPDIAIDSRYLHRSTFNWKNAELRNQKGTVQNRIWEGLQQMEQLRRENPCFGEKAYVTTWDTCRVSVFAVRRTTAENELVCLANFSEEGQMACLPTLEGEYTDLFTGEILNLKSVWMASYQYCWCIRNR